MIPNSATPADITSADWSLMLDGTAAQTNLPSGLGNVVQGVSDVQQCLAIIVMTMPGSVPLRPDFGANILGFIDYPVDAAIPALVATITEQIEKFEPRVDLLSVTAAVIQNDATPNAGARLAINLTWQLRLGVNPGAVPLQAAVTVVTLPLPAN